MHVITMKLTSSNITFLNCSPLPQFLTHSEFLLRWQWLCLCHKLAEQTGGMGGENEQKI